MIHCNHTKVEYLNNPDMELHDIEDLFEELAQMLKDKGL
jgi:hypothetical protein